MSGLPELLLIPHPHLLTPAEGVNLEDGNLRDLIYKMRFVISMHRGVGLAAPQVGDLKRVIMLRGEEDGALSLFINPVYTFLSEGRSDVPKEGCISMPGESRFIERHQTIEVAYLSITGSERESRIDGETARVFQHEMDHLEGVLITDHPEVDPPTDLDNP